MAILDDDNNSVVVRIAYAGPAMSGKTESVRALATALVGKDRSDKKVFSPSEAQGRTMYFDWMDYSAGLFQGRRVRCQIISAPGQPSLVERRRIILQSADAIIFVLDSSPEKLEESIRSYRELQPWVNRGDENDPSPVGVLIQANKRDLDNAVPMETIKERLQADINTGYIGTVALRGTGVREAFVIGVGLALDHTLALMEKGLIKTGSPEIENGEEMFQKMLEHEQSAGDQNNIQVTGTDQSSESAESDLEQVLHHMIHPEEPVHSHEDAASAEIINLFDNQKRITLPSTKVPAGLVWPPVIGRFLLNEINSAEQISYKEDEECITIECAGGYHLRTEHNDIYDSMEKGRERLLVAVNRNLSLKELVNPRRSMVISESDDTDNEWRLWQIVEAKSTLHDELNHVLALTDPQELSSKILNVAMVLLKAIIEFAGTTPPLRGALKSISHSSGSLAYTGFIPLGNIETSDKTKTWPFPRPPLKMVEEEMRPVIARALKSGKINVPAVTRYLEHYATTETKGHNLAEMLSFLFLGH